MNVSNVAHVLTNSQFPRELKRIFSKCTQPRTHPKTISSRLYTNTDERITENLYSQVRSHGFIWAPRQELFVTPAWTPERENFLIELCGKIDDEDKSLVERAEERAERFEQYSERALPQKSDSRLTYKANDVSAPKINS